MEDKAVPASVSEILDIYKQYAVLLSRSVRLKWTDSSLTDKVEMYGESLEKGKVLSVLIKHQTHHRGQMTVVMRMLGLPVIGLYGPSREEWAEFGMAAPE
ncbi:DinB family protein [Pedobacter sp. GR22-6]|uniref:DinB family protein n=1 Tax=Pedobacter sp. GR22-6 TaxID=3127957 RepID=UPI00307DD519